MQPAIRVQGLGKRYRLGLTHARSLNDLASRLTRRMRGLPPTESVIGQSERGNRKGDFWALRDVDFEIAPGEVVGIIGRNGAGKSTLLKILSRVTRPTTGLVEMRGRVASLLEVGTGFHPELTGRENVYMNGTLLGMTHREVTRRFDEIVDFAGVETFIDTPVKRYSSGMKVRLGFAVAAHLEPEILIIDEVLAVGDAEFQKKCLGRMDDIARGGRTVLYVSHQMGTVAQLCSRCILLKNGRLFADGCVSDVVPQYMTSTRLETEISGRGLVDAASPLAPVWIAAARTIDSERIQRRDFLHSEQVALQVTLGCANPASAIPAAVVCTIAVQDHLSRRVLTTQCQPREFYRDLDDSVVMTLPAPLLAPGSYSFVISLHTYSGEMFDRLAGVCPFGVTDGGSEFARYNAGDLGCVLAECEWTTVSRRELDKDTRKVNLV